MKLLKKLYENSKILFALLWIILYCTLMSLGDFLSESFGIQKLLTLPIAILLSALLFFFLRSGSLLSRYGITRPRVGAASMLYYIPLVLMLGANLCYGFKLNYSILETVLYILTMFCVGFLEELIFRGLLFDAMKADNPKLAAVVSALTFGIGHIINLLNGSGADLLSNLLQVVYATAAGFAFVLIFMRDGSLISCILAHGLFNSLSVFIPEENITTGSEILTAAFLTLLLGSYAVYLARTLPKNQTAVDFPAKE